jgi:hypothetical protein
MDNLAEAEKLDQLLTKFPRLSSENQQYITGLIKGLKHAQKAAPSFEAPSFEASSFEDGIKVVKQGCKN